MTTPAGTRRPRALAAVAALALGAAACVAPAPTSTPPRPLVEVARSVASAALDGPGVITSTGPLSRIETTPDLACAVDHVAGADPQFFGGTGCMTAVSWALPGQPSSITTPAGVPGAEAIVGADERFVPVSQTATGSGTEADPFRVVTVARYLNGLLDVTQTDTYVVGEESYRTDIDVANGSIFGPLSGQVYRAADCNLQDSDFGFGRYDSSTGSIACRGVVDPTDPSPQPGDRIVQWSPITPGSSYFEGSAEELWTAVSTRSQLPNTCRCGSGEADYVDNGAGLSWQLSIPSFSSARVSFVTTFSPAGVQPLVASKTADATTVGAGRETGYMITIRNPNAQTRVLTSISDDLPDGFAYRPGTTAGARTTDPVIDGQRLVWAGPVAVPASGEVSLHFGVTASRSPGPTTNDASADAGALTVVPALEAAPVEVIGVPDDPPTVDAGDDVVGTEDAPVTLAGSVVDTDSPAVTHRWTAAPGAGVDPGASCSIANPDALVTQALCNDDGTWTFRLTADDGVNEPVADSLSARLTNVAPVATAPETASGTAGSPVAIDVDVSDGGTNDTATCRAGWGDGSESTVDADGTGRCALAHTYAAAGTFAVSITATDDDGAASPAVGTRVTVDAAVNLPPAVDAGPAISVVEGSAFTTDAMISDPDGPALVHSWSIEAGSDVDPGTSCTTTAVPAIDRAGSCDDDGSFTLRLTASDTVNDPVVDSTALNVTNAPPSVTVGEFPSDPRRAGESILVAARVVDPGTHDVLSCTVDWGDGRAEPGMFRPDAGIAGPGSCSGEHRFTSGGSYLVTVTGSDDDGGASSASVSVLVVAPPVVDAGPAVSGTEGSPITLSGSVTASPGLTPPPPTWSFAPGPGVDPGASCSAPPAPVTQVTCTDDGTWTASISVPDGFGGTVTDSTTVAVANGPPGLGIPGGTTTAPVGSPVQVTATVADPGTNDTASCSIVWGDGSMSAGTIMVGVCSASHSYTGTGTFTIAITVTDDDGGATTRTRTVAITPLSTRTLFVSFGAPVDYRNSGTLTSGRYVVVTDGRGVKSVIGTGTIPGKNAPSLSVTLEVRRVGDLRLWAGTIRWSDGRFGGSTGLLTTDVGPRGAEIKGRQFAVVSTSLGPRVIDLQWAIVP